MALQTRQETQQGLEAQVGVCHVGHFYLAKLLLPALQAASKTHGSARVVALSSSAHTYHDIQACLANEKLDTSPYDPWTAYGNAKAANLLFAKGFNDRYAQGGVGNIYAFSVMPGGIYTGLQDNIDLRSKLNYMTVAPFFFKTVPQGAATSIFCAMAPLEQLAPGHYHDNCAPKRNALDKVLEYCGGASSNVVDECWNQTERLLKELGF